jgi:hypothetical protein
MAEAAVNVALKAVDAAINAAEGTATNKMACKRLAERIRLLRLSLEAKARSSPHVATAVQSTCSDLLIGLATISTKRAILKFAQHEKIIKMIEALNTQLD